MSGHFYSRLVTTSATSLTRSGVSHLPLPGHARLVQDPHPPPPLPWQGDTMEHKVRAPGYLLNYYVPGHYSHIFNIHDDLHRCGALHGRLLSIFKVDKYFLFLHSFDIFSLPGFQSQQHSTSRVSRRSACLSTSFPSSSSPSSSTSSSFWRPTLSGWRKEPS